MVRNILIGFKFNVKDSKYRQTIVQKRWFLILTEPFLVLEPFDCMVTFKVRKISNFEFNTVYFKVI